MAQVGSFRVLRAFLLKGKRCEVGSVVCLDDAELIPMLLLAGKVEPADESTSKRIVKVPFVSWETEPFKRNDQISRRQEVGVMSIPARRY